MKTLPKNLMELQLQCPLILGRSCQLPDTLARLKLKACHFERPPNLPNGLKELRISHCNLRSEWDLPPSLQSLSLNGCYEIRDGFAAKIPKNLLSLKIKQINFTERGVANLPKRLQTLYLNNVWIPDTCLKDLSPFLVQFKLYNLPNYHIKIEIEGFTAIYIAPTSKNRIPKFQLLGT